MMTEQEIEALVRRVVTEEMGRALPPPLPTPPGLVRPSMREDDPCRIFAATLTRGERYRARELYELYRAWGGSIAADGARMSANQFGRGLTRLGFHRRADAQGTFYIVAGPYVRDADPTQACAVCHAARAEAVPS